MWKIDHQEVEPDGTVGVCRLAYVETDEDGKERTTVYQLQTAIRVPPPGPGRGEVPLGEGEVPWPRYLTALREIGYEGYLTIEREVGEDPAADIVTAAKFLREQLKAM